jgi:hypothetical protein
MATGRSIRYSILLILLSIALVLAAVTDAGAALYVGGDHGTRIKIRVKGHRVLSVEATTPLYCRTDPGDKRRVRHERLGWGGKGERLHIDRDGNFRQIERPGVGGESFSSESALIGHLGRNLIKGRFESSYVVSEETFETCQTNRFPYGSPEVHFRAHRAGEGQALRSRRLNGSSRSAAAKLPVSVEPFA